MAHGAAKSVVEKPGAAYNPLFLFGGTGVGKTHLLHAIGHASVERKLNVVYVTLEQFANEFNVGVRQRKTEEFRRHYRRADMLLLDDIQFIVGKEQTQENVLHTFNDLYNTNRQIVITADRPPRNLEQLEERLRSRFEGGLIADIQGPDLETRRAILEEKSAEQEANVPAAVLESIALRVTTDVRELEGNLNRVLTYSSLNHLPLSVELCELALNDSALPGPVTDSSNVVEAVTEYFHLDHSDMVGHRRQKEVVLARHIAMYLLRTDYKFSYPEIGRELGGKDHTTVMYGVDRVSRERDRDPAIREILNEIRDSLSSAV